MKRAIPQKDVHSRSFSRFEAKLGEACRYEAGRLRKVTVGAALALSAAGVFVAQEQANAAFQPLQGSSVVTVNPLADYDVELSEVEVSAPLSIASETKAIEKLSRSKVPSLKKIQKMAELDIDISQTIIPNQDQSALADAGAVVHKVNAGETLAEISKRYEVAAEEILKANGIDNPKELSDNDVLKIPTHQDQANTPKIAHELHASLGSDDGLLDDPELLAKLPDEATEKQSSSLPELSVPIAKRAIFPQIPTLELPPLSSVDTYLPDEMQSGRFRYIMPAKGVLTSGYGPRWGRMHRGIDIAAPVGTTVVASAPGVIKFAGWNRGGYGKLVEVRHPDGSITRYAHNNRITSKVGQYVRQGEKIAEMGSTGRSTGSHTHFEIRPAGKGAVNPMKYLNRG